MNKKEFFEEVLSSDICPDGFLHIIKEFQDYQALTINTLKEFHRVCKLNGIEYQLIYGTLIGAIRDHGQIPWDYDVDVFVRYRDREKLIQALEIDLSTSFYYASREKDIKYPHVFTRITPKGYDTERLHVDVFYTADTPDSIGEIQAFSDSLSELSISWFYRTIDILHYGNGDFKRILKLLAEKTLRIWKKPESIFKQYNDLCEKYSLSGTRYCVSADQFGHKRYYINAELWDLMELKLDGETFFVSKQYDKILTMTYGDYMSVPTLQSRINELLHGYKGLKVSRQ